MRGIQWVTMATLLSLAACGGSEIDEAKHHVDNPGQTALGTGKGQAAPSHVDNPGQTPMKDVTPTGFQLDGGIHAIEQHVDNPGQTPMKP